MKRVQARVCDDCGSAIGPTDRRWDHVTRGGLRVESYCEQCMLGQVSDYARRTIMGMLNGELELRINGEPADVIGARVVTREAVKPERSEP